MAEYTKDEALDWARENLRWTVDHLDDALHSGR